MIADPGDVHDVPPPRDLDWPWWLPAGSVVGAVFVAVEALRHRAVEYGADILPLAVPLAALAVLPFVIDLLGHSRHRFFIPRTLWAAMTIVGVAGLLVQSQTDEDFAPFLLVLVCIQAASTARLPEALVVVVAAAASLVGVELAGEYQGVGVWVVGVIAGFAGGYAVQMSAATVTVERLRQHDRIAKAAVDERQRIAREVHDVIAHSLSVTLLHLTGARRALETGGDAAEAAGALRDAERLGREAMNDIRRTVGLLAPAGSGETAPMPGAADVPGLVDEFSRAGLDAACEVSGDPASVSLATGLGFYRVAQEALANVAKHAPGAKATVTLDLAGDPVRMVVRNSKPNGARPLDDAPDVGGLGVSGMEERTRLLGGTFRAGPDGGGWCVEIAVPREAVVAEIAE